MKTSRKVWISVIGVVAVALISFGIYKVNAGTTSTQDAKTSQTQHKSNQVTAKSNVAKTGKVLPAKK
jgi:hypothetical protein